MLKQADAEQERAFGASIEQDRVKQQTECALQLDHTALPHGKDGLHCRQMQCLCGHEACV